MVLSRLGLVNNIHMNTSCSNFNRHQHHSNRIQEILLKRRKNNPNLIYHNKTQRDHEIQELSKKIKVYKFDEHNFKNIKMEYEMIDFIIQENALLYINDITILCSSNNNKIIQYIKKNIQTRSIQCITSCYMKDLTFLNEVYVTHNFQSLYIDTNVEK